MENLEHAYADDIKIRIADEKLPVSGIATDVSEFDCDGPVYEKNGVKVIAFEVDHGDVIKPCYGYRIEYGSRASRCSPATRAITKMSSNTAKAPTYWCTRSRWRRQS